ncbi:gephyrin-like molybdotransferase Glp [Geobacillus thermodenitrificans]|jgi:molybdopterin molybdotransferase|uniref:Molybdopterin molybdenumtransferase n=2 Tax=Geobacillus thermodenitrificans TaxID=33940 RepID=A0ABY9QG60_GEOTD|nr:MULTISPECIES: gephyrin-like molybdotransferase Glp [Geobacillus]MED3717535.1 molybdopterin molybdotransferase MoeA [Geobacillus thermodenitrificans]MED3906373.1 molybdopterin molybdotransferase MoeA [Geobacillus thermodenitrificans]NNU86300.1 molybdopterin molybdenumtransferase MoeA [Geobacillus sp. MR]OQP11454.1 molybdopterin molybdenumtransferase [Geobacillus sp. 47C-IIb]QNU30498.1 molybdopterin molybdotransferase MoeA [Geobacillus sp. 47C-IIb]
MVERRTPIPVAEAINRVMCYAGVGEEETVPLRQSYGRYLAEDLCADHDVPPFDRSPYDGFAIRAADSQEAGLNHPVEFEVIEAIGAGQVATKTVGPFQAVRLMTGAQIPNGCDAVVMLELTKQYERDGKTYMSIKRPFRPRDNISFQGEDAKKGTPLVKKGTRINPGVAALLATFGYAEVKVAKKPRIGLFATGSELLDVSEPLVPGKIRNSNAYMIEAQALKSGAELIYFGQLADDLDACFHAVREALDQVDMLITTGGVSVGDYDYLPAIYERLQANVLFNKIAMRPGSVTTVAEWNGKLLFGLSGNPSACYVGYELFVRPVVRTRLFSTKPYLKKVKATLGADFPKPNPFTRFVRSRVEAIDGRLIVKPVGMDKSNIVTSLAAANALMVLPGGTRGFAKDDEVDVWLLDDDEGSSE